MFVNDSSWAPLPQHNWDGVQQHPRRQGAFSQLSTQGGNNITILLCRNTKRDGNQQKILSERQFEPEKSCGGSIRIVSHCAITDRCFFTLLTTPKTLSQHFSQRLRLAEAQALSGYIIHNLSRFMSRLSLRANGVCAYVCVFMLVGRRAFATGCSIYIHA